VLLTPTKPLHLIFNWNTSSSLGFVVVVVIFLCAWINIEWNCWVSVNQESSGTLPAAATNKHTCHSLQIGNLVIVVWLVVVILLFFSKKYYRNSFFEDGRRFRYFRLLQFEQWPLRYWCRAFCGYTLRL